MPLDDDAISDQLGHCYAAVIVVVQAERDFEANPSERTDKAVEAAQKAYDDECDALLEMVRAQLDR